MMTHFPIFSRMYFVTTVCMLALLPMTPTSAGEKSSAAKEVAVPGWQLQFENINPAIKMAAAYGDRNAGMHGSFGRFPPNFETPMHTHSGAYHGVVIKGIMTNPFKGESKPPTMEPGSYWHVPAGAKHTTACISDIPCEFYFHADSKFDFNPVK
ncbi:MAG: DUF4437 domain-containing protein [Gammaproteobacteria bacterium]|nr:DUF4437 domain-containing protein [Gammaproteobacteria bacterium]